MLSGGKNQTSNRRNPRFNKEFVLTFIFSVGSSVLGFVFSFLAAKFLEADGYGEVNYYLSISSLLTVFITCGGDNFLIKRLQFEADRKSAMARIYFLLLLTSFLTLPIYFLIAYFGLAKLNQNLLIIFTIFIASVAGAFTTIIAAYFTGLSKNQIRTLISGVAPHLGMLFFFAVHYFTNTLDLFIKLYLIYSTTISLCCVVPFVATHCHRANLKFTKAEITQLLTFALIWICYNTTNPIANVFIGEKYEQFNVVGIFSLSNQLLTVATLANSIIINISYPVFARYSKEGDHEKLFRYYQTVTRVNMYISVPFYIAFASEASNLYSFFGESYSGYNLILILLSTSSMIECVTGPSGSVLLMGGKERENLYTAIAKFVVYIGILAVSINYTVYAAPIAAVVGTCVANILKLYFLWKMEGRNYFNLKLILPWLSLCLICFACFYPLSFISNLYIWAVLNCVVGLGLIVCFLLLTPFKADRKFLFRSKDELLGGIDV